MDARFEDGGEKPLNLAAMEVEDFRVLSALTQDAVFPITEMRWDNKARRFAILLNRFRWENSSASGAVERVQSILSIENVVGVSSQGIDRADKDTVLSLLSVAFEPTDEPAGQVILTLAGDGAIRVSVEALEGRLKDVTRPYTAPSGKAPSHDV